MHGTDPFVVKLDALLVDAERFRDRGSLGEAASRARHVIALARRELVRRPAEAHAPVDTRRFLAERLIESLRVAAAPCEDLRWLERAIAQLDVGITAIRADGEVTDDERRTLASLDLGHAARVDTYRDAPVGDYDHDLVTLFARALDLDADTLSGLEADVRH